VGDIPNYGPLFVSSWAVETTEHRVVDNRGRELKGRERRRWLDDNYDTLEASGEPVDDPLREAVRALLSLPAPIVQDYPDLLMRCDNGHGDYVADRKETIALLRQAVANGKPMDHPVPVSLPELEYLPPRDIPGPSESSTRSVTRRPKLEVMTVSEWEARRMRDTRDD
jgi:hypothetical protein